MIVRLGYPDGSIVLGETQPDFCFLRRSQNRQVTATLTSSVPAFSSVVNSASIAPVEGELERLNNLAMDAVFAGQQVYLPVIQWR